MQQVVFNPIQHRFSQLIIAGHDPFNFFGCTADACCKHPHFCGHDSKTFSGRARPRGFDGGIQGNKPGLHGKAADGLNHTVNTVRLIVKPGYITGHRAHPLRDGVNHADAVFNDAGTGLRASVRLHRHIPRMHSRLLFFLVTHDICRDVCCEFHNLIKLPVTVKNRIVSGAKPQRLSPTVKARKLAGEKLPLIQPLPELAVFIAF